MTKINKPVKHETSGMYRGRAITAELHAGYMVLSPKGTQQRYMIDYETVFDLAMKRDAMRVIADRKGSK
jgi:hypothetical protein